MNQWQRWRIQLIPVVILLLSVLPNHPEMELLTMLDWFPQGLFPAYSSEEAYLRHNLSCDNRSHPLVTLGMLLLTQI